MAALGLGSCGVDGRHRAQGLPSQPRLRKPWKKLHCASYILLCSSLSREGIEFTMGKRLGKHPADPRSAAMARPELLTDPWPVLVLL